MRVRRFAAAALLLSAGAAHAAEIFVSSASDIANALGSVQPGDELVMTNGTWTNQFIEFDANGTASQPITLRPQTPGQVLLNGTSRIEIGGEHLVVEGLRFEGGALSASQHIVRFRNGSSNPAHNCVLRDTTIIDYNPASVTTRYFWVSLYGTNNIVENCYFENQNHSGVVVTIWEDFPNNHIVRNNHFFNMPEDPSGGNGWETIRIGTSEFTNDVSNTLIESNLFERCDGEIEIISSKTGNNTMRYNTFLECKGTLTLRHGFDGQVHGNFFLGNNKNGSGGIRVIGPGHRIWNNYFEKLDDRDGAVIPLYAGQVNAPNSGYEIMTDVIVAHNTIVDCGEVAFDLARGLGSNDRTVLPSGVTLLANLIRSPSENVADSSNSNIAWIDNLAFASGLGTANGSGVTLLGSDPLALAADGLARPVGGSPGTTGSTFTLATDDMDGDPRTQPNDIGADHVSANAPIRGPLTSEDVGPSWFSTGGDPNTSIAAFVEAEGADAILDPDGDSNVFFVQSVPGASNDEVLKSPSGSTSSPGNSETMAVYQVTFPNTGNYTAYYLARGFNGSTNSFFTPTDFATDPTQNETTSSDSNFRWETGDQFTVNSTGAPLEFRIGRRERDTEIDIIVFHPTDNLTDQELDDLVAEWQAGVCDADIDENGVLDFFDMLGYLDLYDAGDLEADTSGDGGLSPTDVIRYILSNEAGCP